MSDNKIGNVELVNIPPLPTIMTNVMKFNPNIEGSDASTLESMIAPDKGITAEVLRVSNSALYARNTKNKTLRDAITLMGVKPVKSFVIVLATKSISGTLRGETFKKFLFEYPIISALVAADICRPLKMNTYREDVFVGSLLQKIGMTLIALNKGKEYANLIERSQTINLEIVQAEEKVYQTNHYKVGEFVFQKWKMPEEYMKLVTDGKFSNDQIPEVDKLVLITIVASIIAKKILNMYISEIESEKLLKIIEFFELEENKLDAFYSEDYYEMLRQHPFYQDTMG